MKSYRAPIGNKDRLPTTIFQERTVKLRVYMFTRQIITTSAEVTLNGGLVRESSQNGRGLVCTRGQGPHLYTRTRASSVHAEWVCCMYPCVLTAVYFAENSCVQVHRYRSSPPMSPSTPYPLNPCPHVMDVPMSTMSPKPHVP